jgi:serine/threonine protein kinase
MKTINKQRAVASGTPLMTLHQEIDMLTMLDHPHILRLFEHYEDSHNIYIITAMCEGGELLDIVEEHARKRRPLPEQWIATVFRQSVEAIAYCHAKGVMETDL